MSACIPEEMCSESRDLFKFWEISDNISDTVQDTYIAAMEDQQDIVCGLSNGTICQCPWMTLKITLLFETFIPLIARET